MVMRWRGSWRGDDVLIGDIYNFTHDPRPVAPVDKQSPLWIDLCFSERWSRDAAKVRAEPRHRTDAAVLGKRGLYQSTAHSPLKTARKKIGPEECRAPSFRR